MKVPFFAFWTAALLSNTLATAQSVAVSWILGDTRFPTTVLLVFQAADLVGTLAGVWIGSIIASRIGYRRALALASLLEAAFCVTVAMVAFTSDATMDVNQAYAVAIAMGGAPFAMGLGGPVWIALVSQWPGTRGESRQLLLDGVQFQLGSLLGPLVGGFAIAAIAHAVQWLSVFNAASYIFIALIMLVMSGTGRKTGGRSAQTPSSFGQSLRVLRLPAAWAMAAFALATESSRIYLPRMLRESGEPASTLSIVLATMALSASLSALIASRASLSDTRLSRYGLVAIAAALAAWAIAPVFGIGVWILGAVAIGAGTGVVGASIMSVLMSVLGDRHRALGAAAGLGIRTVFGALGGLLFGFVVPVLGTLSFGITAVVVGVVGASVGGLRQRDCLTPAPRAEEASLHESSRGGGQESA